MNQDRREFIKTSIQGLTACCFFAGCRRKPELSPDAYVDAVSKDLTCCAYRCSRECPWLSASLKGDKRTLDDLAEQWSVQHGGQKITDEEKFCYGCKPVSRPLGHIVAVCTVRKCVIEKGFSTCMECENLKECDKDLWTLYPTHRDYVLKEQKAAAMTKTVK